MRSNALWTVSLSVAAILLQYGCSTNGAETQDPTGSRQNITGAGQSSVPSGGTSRVRGSGSPYNSVVLPEGTVLAVRTTSTLSSNVQEAGQKFTASLAQPVLLAGREIVARGAQVEGAIVDADKGGRVKGVAGLTIRLTGLQVSGQFVDISTNTVTRNARTTKKADGVKIAIGSGVGAAIGAIAGGGKGAAIGAAAGGGAGSGVVLATRGEPAVIPSETLLNFELQAPVTVAGK